MEKDIHCVFFKSWIIALNTKTLRPWPVRFRKSRQMQLNIQASERSARHPRFPSYTSKTSLQFHPLPDLESWLWTFSGRYGKPISCYKSPSRPSEATTSVEKSAGKNGCIFFQSRSKSTKFPGDFLSENGLCSTKLGSQLPILLGLLENFPHMVWYVIIHPEGFSRNYPSTNSLGDRSHEQNGFAPSARIRVSHSSLG